MESVDKPVRSPCLETHSKKKSFSISCPCPVVFFFVFRLPDKRQEVNISSLVTLLSISGHHFSEIHQPEAGTHRGQVCVSLG